MFTAARDGDAKQLSIVVMASAIQHSANKTHRAKYDHGARRLSTRHQSACSNAPRSSLSSFPCRRSWWSFWRWPRLLPRSASMSVSSSRLWKSMCSWSMWKSWRLFSLCLRRASTNESRSRVWLVFLFAADLRRNPGGVSVFFQERILDGVMEQMFDSLSPQVVGSKCGDDPDHFPGALFLLETSSSAMSRCLIFGRNRHGGQP